MILKIKLDDGKNLSSIVQLFAPAQDIAADTATPAHSHQLAEFGCIQASCIAGNPAIVIASVLATIADLGPRLHQQITAMVAPVADTVSTIPQCHMPLVSRMKVTRAAPKVNPAGSQGRRFPAARQLSRIRASRIVHMTQLAVFCGMLFATK